LLFLEKSHRKSRVDCDVPILWCNGEGWGDIGHVGWLDRNNTAPRAFLLESSGSFGYDGGLNSDYWHVSPYTMFGFLSWRNTNGSRCLLKDRIIKWPHEEASCLFCCFSRSGP